MEKQRGSELSGSMIHSAVNPVCHSADSNAVIRTVNTGDQCDSSAGKGFSHTSLKTQIRCSWNQCEDERNQLNQNYPLTSVCAVVHSTHITHIHEQQ